MGSGGLPYHYNTDFRKLTPPGVAGLPGGGPPGGRLPPAPGQGTRGGCPPGERSGDGRLAGQTGMVRTGPPRYVDQSSLSVMTAMSFWSS